MPRIPVYQQQVAPADMPGVRMNTNFSPQAFGSGVAQGVGMVADSLDKGVQTAMTIQEKIQKKKDAIWVQERLSKLAQQYDTYSYGSPEGKVAGVLTSKGLAAADAAKNAPEALEKFYSDLSAESPSQDALLEFQTRAISIKSSASSTIARHAATELNRYHAEAAMGNANVQSELSARDYNQAPEALKEAFDTRVAPSIKEAARLTGTPVEEALMAARSTFYEQVISQNLAAGDTKRASALLARDDWNDALDAKTRSTLTEKIRKETITQESLASATKLVESGMSDSAAKKWIDETYAGDIDMRDATMTRFRQEKVFRAQEAEEGKKAQYGNLLKALYTETDPRKRTEMAMRANPEFFQGALAFAESLNKPPADSPELKEATKRYDTQVNAELRRMVDAGLFASEHELYAKATELNVRDISNISDSVKYWQGGGGGLKDSEVRTLFAEVTGSQANSKPQVYAAVYDYILSNAPKAEGRQVPPETVRKLMNQALLTKDGGWFGSDKSLAEHFRAGGTLDTFEADIPDSDRDTIIAELKRRKVKVSETNIQRVYKAEFMGFPQATQKPQNVRGH